MSGLRHTDVDEFDSVLDDGVEGIGGVFEHLVLIDRTGVLAQPPLLQHLDQGHEGGSVAQISGQVLHLVARIFEHVVHPIAKGVRLDFHPNILVAFDGHTCGSVTLRASCHQAAVRDEFGIAFHFFYFLVIFVFQLDNKSTLSKCYGANIFFFFFGLDE